MKNLLPSLLLFLVFACNQPTEIKVITPAFYYWKSEFRLNKTEQKILQDNHIKKLYIKFFDIDLQNNQPVAKASLRFLSKPDTGINIVPTVFITNKTILALHQTTEVDTLAKKLLDKINNLANSLSYNEIQIDCDWTPNSRKRYFDLLTKLKKQLPSSKTLSATIRLHQVKFPAITGVPPVDRGMLMCYNMADWKNINTKNSIFDPKVLAQYIEHLDQYDLPLDVVFPSFRWTIFYRNGRFLKFTNNLDAKALDSYTFLEKTSQNRFECRQDTFALGMSLRKGDLLRTEQVLMEDLLTEKEHILSKISNQKLTFTLFHLDSTSLAPYSHAAIQKIFVNQTQN